jgi:hypothetical protein
LAPLYMDLCLADEKFLEQFCATAMKFPEKLRIRPLATIVAKMAELSLEKINELPDPEEK